VEAVITARAQLVDCLPLVLMFDLRDEDEDADNGKTLLSVKKSVFLSLFFQAYV